MDTFKILLQRQPKQAHREVEITIDWEGITDQQLKVLARIAIVEKLKARWIHEGVPEKKFVMAAEMTHLDLPYEPKNKYYVPKAPQEQHHMSGVDKLLQNCSEEERKQLLALLS